MNRNTRIFRGPANMRRGGQVMPLLAMSMTVLFGMDALVIDFGRVFVHQSELTSSAQAAALAGAEAMAQPGATSGSVTTVVQTYSGVSGDDNAVTNLPGVSLASGYPVLACLATVKGFGTACYGPSSANAIVVKQQESVPLMFARIFGDNSVTITSVATAAMKGALSSPYNVAIIVDSTQSMNSSDSDSECNTTRIKCALSGVQVLLQTLSPCASNLTTCGTVTSGNVASSLDRVSLLTFPSVTTATIADDYNCSGTQPATAAYATPFPATSTYQVVNFSSDYRSSDSASSLSSTSNLVRAVGGKSGCPEMIAKGGFGTFYAQVIYAAQANLATEKSSFSGSQNVLIVLSDGDATASCTTSSHGVCTAGDMIGASTSGTAYIATNQECHQAITAAAAAATAGTRVYSVAYGATASGCTTDTSPSITPCQTMEQMASNANYFYSDYKATGGSSSCVSASQPVTSLNAIFTSIAEDLTYARLIPNGTT